MKRGDTGTVFIVCEDSRTPIKVIDWHEDRADAERTKAHARERNHPNARIRVGCRVNGEWRTL